MTPVVGLIRPPFELRPDTFEVAEIFEVPLAFLLDPANHQRNRVVYQGWERHYYAMPFRDYYIWGATAGMIMNFYRFLTAPDVYARRPTGARVMTLFSIILVLALEQWRPLAERDQLRRRLHRYAEVLVRHFNAGERQHGPIAWLLAVVPIVAIGLVVYAFLLEHPLPSRGSPSMWPCCT